MGLPHTLLMVALGLWLQGGGPLPNSIPAECVTPDENRKLATEKNIDSRVKVYRQISERHAREVQAVAGKSKFEELPALLECWRQVLNVSLKDIEANINRKKKSGALKDYEIQLRKALVALGDIRIRAPYQLHEQFDAWINEVTTIRERFVDLLFQR